MKKMLFIVIQIIFLGTTCSYAESYAEQDSSKNLKFYVRIEGQASNDRIYPEFYGAICHNFSFFGFFAYLPAGNGFNQICFGPALFPFKWMCIGGGITPEQKVPGAFLLLEKNRCSLFAIYEKGVYQNSILGIKTDWYQANFTVKINNRFNAGVMTQRFYGSGCRLEFRVNPEIEKNMGLPKTKIWCALLNGNELENKKIDLNFLFGINFQFNLFTKNL